MEGYTQPFRRDRNINGGGILIYVEEGISSRELKMTPHSRTPGRNLFLK